MTASTGELTSLTVAELSRRIKAKEVSPVEVAQAFAARIESLEPRLGAFITRMTDSALASAKQAADEIAGGGYKGPLHGIPVAVKDIFWTAGVRTTSGSKVDADFVPDRDATAVRRVREVGAYPIGKTNTVEFAFSPTGENSHYGMPKNPWGLDRLPGGSSSGSGVAVAACMAPLALGTDTGGSVRIPSALCGLTGLKPTFGLISRAGVTPLSWTLDTVGPMCRTAEDVALAMNALAGPDPDDPASVRSAPVDYAAGLDRASKLAKGMRIAVPREFVWDVMEPEVKVAFQKAMEALEGLGAGAEEVSIPELEWVPAIAATITTAEAGVLHRDRLRRRGADYDPAVRRRAESGLFIPAATYVQAMRARVLFARRLSRVFQRFDLLALPTEPMAAPQQGLERMQIGGVEHSVRESLLRLTRVCNVARLPSIAVPCGFSSEGLPLSMQLAAPAFEDARVIRAAHAYQQATDWHTRRPEIAL